MFVAPANSNAPLTGKLAENIMHFARVLREAGIPVGPGSVLDALDETNSEVKIYDEPEGKSYDFMGGTRFFFKEDIIGSAHIFRMAYAQLEIICDQQTKDACKVGGLKGIRFRDAAEY